MLDSVGLHAAYGAIPAVRGVDLHVEEGEAVVVLGRNGAGKSTTLAVLAGAKRPTSGQIWFRGREITHAPAEQRVGLGVALVPEGRGIFPTLTVRDNLRAGAHVLRLSGRDLQREFDRVTERFPRLRERMNQAAGSLSGGEAQMLAIARGLMSRPRFLMLDEPSLGLAPTIVNEIYQLFSELVVDGMTVLLVEQYAAVALRFATRGYVLHKGQVVLEGSAEMLSEEGVVERAYMAATA